MRRDETCGWRDSFFAVSLNEGLLRQRNRATGKVGGENKGSRTAFIPHQTFNYFSYNVPCLGDNFSVEND